MKTDQEFEVFPGIYRGTVEAVADPQQRKRYRVRVTNVHPAEIETNHLPWGELGAVFGGSLFGDIPGYEIGDPVWVMFEGGNRRFPVIMGGIFNNAGGVPPIPSEQVGDEYERQSKRWIRTDRSGNKIEMSPLEDELFIRIQTIDGSTLEVRGIDGEIFLSGVGRVRVEAPSCQVEATQDCTVITPNLLADVADSATIRSLGIVNVRSAETVNIGEYAQPDTTGTGLAPVETTPTINIKAVDLVKIESADLIDVDAAGEIQVNAVGNILVETEADLTMAVLGNTLIDLEGNLQLDCEGDADLNVTGNVTADVQGTMGVTSVGALTIQCEADVVFEANASFRLASGATMTIESSADLAISSTASLSIDTSANLDMTAAGQLSISAATIEISATGLLDLQGGSLAQLDAGAILIG